jgi:hypothetical protein
MPVLRPGRSNPAHLPSADLSCTVHGKACGGVASECMMAVAGLAVGRVIMTIVLNDRSF